MSWKNLLKREYKSLSHPLIFSSQPPHTYSWDYPCGLMHMLPSRAEGFTGHVELLGNGTQNCVNLQL